MNLSPYSKLALFAPFSVSFRVASCLTCSSIDCEATLGSVVEFRFALVFGLFWSIFDSFSGGNIRNVDITPRKRIKNRLKRTEKSTETEFDDRPLKSPKKIIKNHKLRIRG